MSIYKGKKFLCLPSFSKIKKKSYQIPIAWKKAWKKMNKSILIREKVLFLQFEFSKGFSITHDLPFQIAL